MINHELRRGRGHFFFWTKKNIFWIKKYSGSINIYIYYIKRIGKKEEGRREGRK